MNMQHLIDQPKPRNLQAWAWQAMHASYKFDSVYELEAAWFAICDWLNFVNSLPVLDSNPTTGG